MEYFLDTSVIISVLRNKKELVKALRKCGREFNSGFIVLAELYEGVFRVKNKDKEEKEIMLFFSKLKNIYGINMEISKKFGEIRSNLKSSGKIIEDMDILIAATCIVNNLTLITSNKKHFERIEKLSILEV